MRTLPSRFLAAALGLAALTAAPAAAYTVSPLTLEMGPGAYETRLTIDNSGGGEPLTMSISVYKVTDRANPLENREPADGDFLVFPPQSVVPPGQSQVVRVQYLGNEAGDHLYHIETDQVPVDLQSGQGMNLKVGLRYRVTARVEGR